MPRRRTAPAPRIIAPDFLLALPEMRAELARQDRLAGRFYVQGRSELDIGLSSLVRPLRRRA